MRWRKFGVVKKGMILLGGLGLVWFGWWGSDIPIGYYEFRERCNREGGPRLLGIIAKDSGWMVSSEIQAKSVVAAYRFVPFARYISDDDQLKDVLYKGGNPWWSSSYAIEEADLKRSVNYKYFVESENVSGAIRLRRDISLLVDLFTGEELFVSTSFTYTWTNPERTLLGRSDKVRCPGFAEEDSAVDSLF
ncbi:hypothetical protein [Pseudomonas indica]|uniref:hypothetical protein n=1 Tax=Pseudomonas indica TaxID=137658 RepID=UPI001140FB41|nr:hypothetical protein [Pseudomonas indica]